ncbi:MAG: mechanosensitive ion channel [Bacteroidetes bacterium]|nr:MAG: mechanosensitive ion channel [Bacteroidota bacterium]
MENYQLQLIETILVVLGMVLLQFFNRNAIVRVLKKFNFGRHRRKMTTRILNFFVFLTAGITITAIWGLEQSDLLLFLSSILTVLGIAFFAQWSILSNITSSLILFFNHPVKVGDRVRFLDKEYDIEGRITEIGFFFMHIQTNEQHEITVPNSVVLQKVFSILKDGNTAG